MIGSFGPIAFSASSSKIFTLSGFGKGAESRFAEHDLAGKKPLLSFVGPGLESISFNMKLSLTLGVDPVTEINRLRDLRDNGIAQPFVLGGEYIGDYVIKSLSESHRAMDGKGNLIAADISVSMKEYFDDRV